MWELRAKDRREAKIGKALQMRREGKVREIEKLIAEIDETTPLDHDDPRTWPQNLRQFKQQVKLILVRLVTVSALTK